MLADLWFFGSNDGKLVFKKCTQEYHKSNWHGRSNVKYSGEKKKVAERMNFLSNSGMNRNKE